MPRLLRTFAGFVALVLLGGAGLVATSTNATAASTLLCTSYAGCQQAGMSNAGYATANSTMYWRMYSGHNCTNYAAYRMVHSGLPNTRPWSGDGNATNWGYANPDLTDQTPAVGAVAWWKAYAPPAGSAGHVAYVEQVISPDEIVVSQDSWGGDFSWARITRTSGRWPTGFIHFNDVKLLNVAKPAVAGFAKVGAVLSATPGSWSQPGVTYRYQWRANGTDIAGATAPTLTVDPTQQGKLLAVRVQAVKTGFKAAAAYSPRTPSVLPGTLQMDVTPTIVGQPKVDEPLSLVEGSWQGGVQGVAETYQWTADGLPIAGATGTTFTPGPDQVGRVIGATVSASLAHYDPVVLTTPATAAVAPGTFAVTAPPALTGTTELGETLTVDTGAFTPADENSTVSVQWLRSGDQVPGATGSTYTITPADLGHRISAVVTVERPGYEPLVQTTDHTAVVRTTPTMTVTVTTPRKGRVHFVVHLRAPGVPTVPGTVQVRSHGKVLAEGTLRRGAMATTLTGLRPGKRTFTLRYRFTPQVRSLWVSRAVQVR